MIISFGEKQTEKIWRGIRVKELPNDIQLTGREEN